MPQSRQREESGEKILPLDTQSTLIEPAFIFVRRIRMGSNTTSRRFLKKHGLANPLAAPSLNDLILLHDAWISYYLQSIAGDVQGSQFQTR
jgi:hypothetical protein